MAEIVNLRMARKAKARSASETAAAANRVRFGAAKSEKSLIEARRIADGKHLDAHRLSTETVEKP